MSVVNNVPSFLDESNILEVYSVRNGESHVSVPFSMNIGLRDSEGKQAAVEAMVDDGAMVAAMDTKVYESLRSELGGWRPTKRKFRMANGTVVLGETSWVGCINVQGVEVDGEFEVFDSGGSWKFLFGKPLLELFLAVHDYGKESLMLHGKQGSWREVFNGGLGAVVAPEPTPVLEDRSQQGMPRLTAQAQVVLEESVGPAGGVIVKALTPLDREVDNLCCDKQNSIANNAGQRQPETTTLSRRHALQIEESDTSAPERPLEREEDTDDEEWQMTEAELEEWYKELRQLHREETIEQQKELELRQQERRKIWEEEEERREADWVAWLRRQRAEPGLRKWFFWRNRLRNPSPPRRLRVDSLGGSNAPPSREVSADAGGAVEHHIDHISAEHQPHDAAKDATNPTTETTSGASRREGMGDNTENMPDGSRVDSVGGCDVPPSREVLSEDSSDDPQHADRSQTVPVCVLRADEDYPSHSDVGLDFFLDVLDQSEDVHLFTRNDGEKGAFRPEHIKEILRK
ncbi:hypothetical protein EV359DRAFT_86298, partial [Lentinula novae-zelandiae]